MCSRWYIWWISPCLLLSSTTEGYHGSSSGTSHCLTQIRNRRTQNVLISWSYILFFAKYARIEEGLKSDRFNELTGMSPSPSTGTWTLESRLLDRVSGVGGGRAAPVAAAFVGGLPIVHTIMRQQKGHIRQSYNRPISDASRSLCVSPLQLLVNSLADQPVVLKTTFILYV